MRFNDQERSGAVTLSTFAPLSVNSAKGLARWAQRCFAALILRCAQDDMTGCGWEISLSANGPSMRSPGR